MKKILIAILSFYAVSVYSDFIQSPWLGNFLEFHFRPSFKYRHYNDVSRGFNPEDYSSSDRFTNFDLAVAFLPDWDFQAGIEFADTRKQSFGTQSAAIQARYQWLNDISGDPVSLTTGLQIRWVSHRSLKDVSCVYSSDWNFELINSIGKEFPNVYSWNFRTFATLGIGQGNNGRPYLNSILAFIGAFRYHHRLKVFADSYFGFGHERFIDVSKFDGYGRVFHQSIDLGLGYYYFISQSWGTIAVNYSYRVFAKAFPSRANTFIIKYDFPFSFF